jgi:hypothetical protein
MRFRNAECKNSHRPLPIPHSDIEEIVQKITASQSSSFSKKFLSVILRKSTLLTSSSSLGSYSVSTSSSSSNSLSPSLSVVLRNSKPKHPDDLQYKSVVMMIQWVNIILNLGQVFRIFKPLLKCVAWSMDYFQPGLHPILRYISLFPNFAKLIVDVTIREPRTKELEAGDEEGGLFCSSCDCFWKSPPERAREVS